MRIVLVAITAIAVAVQADVSTHSRNSVVGTWQLVSASASTADGRVIDAPFGVSPTGVITYTTEGRMMAMISYGGRKPLSGDRISSPAPERADAFATFFAYAGRYWVDGDKVVHHVEISSVQNWVNTDMHRLVKFDGDRITLRTPPLSVGGTTQATDLVWERVK
jgi:lipocalin-like protein